MIRSIGVKNLSTESIKKIRRMIAAVTGERWLREFCAKGDCPSYESIMEAIKNGGFL